MPASIGLTSSHRRQCRVLSGRSHRGVYRRDLEVVCSTVILRGRVKMAGFYLVSLIVALAVVLQHEVKGDGFIRVRFDRYTNPGGIGSNFHCCDGKYGICQRNGCDHKFTICLHSEPHEGALNTDECDYGITRSIEVKNQNTIEFGSVFGGVENPMSFELLGQIPESFQLMVDVWDDDDIFSDDFVEFLKADVSFPNDPKTRFPVVLDGRTRLETTVWIECAPYYFGQLCGTLCPEPQPDEYYYCDQNTGEKKCKPGWTGYNCVDRVTTKSPSTTTPWPTTTTTTPRPTTTTTTTTTPRPTTTTTPMTTTTTYAPTTPAGRFDCDEWARSGYAYQDGVYELSVAGLHPFSAWCDMDSYGEGWTVIQRRNGDNGLLTNFYRSWSSYRQGFGDIDRNSEYWLGLEKMHRLTTQKRFMLHINMQIGNGEFRWARYERFWIENEAEGYKLHVEDFSGNAGDALNYLGLDESRLHNGQPFSTFDTDFDGWTEGSCAQKYKSGWWFNDCAWANLNGVYQRPLGGWPPCRGAKCLGWRTIVGYEAYSLLRTEMRIRPNPRDED